MPMASTIPATYLGIATAGTVVAEWDPRESLFVVQEIKS